MPWTMLLVTASLLVVAFLFSTVGHGGASGYLAVLALVGMAPETIRPTALLLNVIVSSVALFRFAGRGHFRWNVFWPFSITAVPCAFLAGWQWSLEAQPYRIALGLILLFAAWLLIVKRPETGDQIKARPLITALLIGAVIGTLSGLIGIGGGIFLTPVLIFFAWSTAKQAAAVSAAFILVSSLAGLSGLVIQFNGLNVEPMQTTIFAVAVLIGGFAGSTIGASIFSPLALRRALAVVLIIAAVKMFLPIQSDDGGDGSISMHHASNAGRIRHLYRADMPFPPHEPETGTITP